MEQRCHFCGALITGRHYVDWGGHRVCSSHGAAVKQCVCCGQFCDSSAVDVGADGKLCAYCQAHLMTRKDCAYVVNFINRIYSGTEIGEIHNWHLKVIDAPALQKKTGDSRVRGLAEKRGDEYTVYVYRQLSKVQFANVLAHELLHIWQYNRNIYTIPLLREGFCNLGSYVVLSNIDTKEAKAALDCLLSSPDPIYGEGLRKCKQLYDAGGWPNVIRHLRNTPNI